jgi:hypothetical protein
MPTKMTGLAMQMRITLPNILSWRSVQVHLNINCEAEKEKANTKESQSTQINDAPSLLLVGY